MKIGAKSYFRDFFIKLYFIPALFFTAGFLTILFANLEFGFLRSLNYNVLNYIVFFCFFYALILAVYVLSNIRKKTLSVSDCISFALGLTAMVYLFYVLVILKKYNIYRIIVFFALFVLSVISIVFRAIKYSPEIKTNTIFYTKNSLNGYFHALNKHYAFFGIILFAIVLSCISFIMMRKPYALPIDSPYRYRYLVLLGVIFLFLVFGASFKKVTLLDAGLVSGVISAPTALAYILIVADGDFRKNLLTYFLIAIGVVLFIFIVRFLSFDISKIDKSSLVKHDDKRIKNYIGKYSRKFGFFVTIATASATALLTVFFSDYWVISDYSFGGHYVYTIVPVLIPIFTVYATMLVGLILSLTNFKSKKITFGDFFTVFNIFFALAGFLVFNNTVFKYEFFVLLGILFYSLTILVARIKIHSYND